MEAVGKRFSNRSVAKKIALALLWLQHSLLGQGKPQPATSNQVPCQTNPHLGPATPGGGWGRAGWARAAPGVGCLVAPGPGLGGRPTGAGLPNPPPAGGRQIPKGYGWGHSCRLTSKTRGRSPRKQETQPESTGLATGGGGLGLGRPGPGGQRKGRGPGPRRVCGRRVGSSRAAQKSRSSALALEKKNTGGQGPRGGSTPGGSPAGRARRRWSLPGCQSQSPNDADPWFLFYYYIKYYKKPRPASRV